MGSHHRENIDAAFTEAQNEMDNLGRRNDEIMREWNRLMDRHRNLNNTMMEYKRQFQSLCASTEETRSQMVSELTRTRDSLSAYRREMDENFRLQQTLRNEFTQNFTRMRELERILTNLLEQ